MSITIFEEQIVLNALYTAICILVGIVVNYLSIMREITYGLKT